MSSRQPGFVDPGTSLKLTGNFQGSSRYACLLQSSDGFSMSASKAYTTNQGRSLACGFPWTVTAGIYRAGAQLSLVVTDLATGVVVPGPTTTTFTARSFVSAFSYLPQQSTPNAPTPPSSLPTPPQQQPIASAALVHISTGTQHTCAYFSNQTIFCWGSNSNGQLGVGTSTQQNGTAQVRWMGEVSFMVSGNSHNCIFGLSGSNCWGLNSYGQLAVGDTTNVYTPAATKPQFSGVISASAGEYHTCVVLANNTVYCWGANNYGQLGDGTYNNAKTGVQSLTGPSISVCAGGTFTCVLNATGTVSCFGRNNLGQLGLPATPSTNYPTPQSGFSSSVKEISCGFEFACALSNWGFVRCWGLNNYGQLGNGGQTDNHIPQNVTGLVARATQIQASKAHACALLETGGVMCWGYNQDGELGVGDTTFRTKATQVVGLTSGVVKLFSASKAYHTCAKLVNGTLACWGFNTSGQIIVGTNQLIPVTVQF